MERMHINGLLTLYLLYFRDPNAYLLVKGLQDSFLHEGAIDGSDFTQVNLYYNYIILYLINHIYVYKNIFKSKK